MNPKSAVEKRARVWVSPNRNTLGLTGVLLGMWYAGASQNNGAAYLLCFIIFSAALVSAVHAWANLRGVQLQAVLIKPVWEGDNAVIGFIAKGSSRNGHYSITARSLGGSEIYPLGDLLQGTPTQCQLSVPMPKRGHFTELTIELNSLYPLGFFSAKKKLVLAQSFYVYPKPLGSAPLPDSRNTGGEWREGFRGPGDDFAGVRGYKTGESQRHIDWKAVSRGQPMLVKQWSGDSDDLLHLDWDALRGLDVEARLRQLSAWVLQAERCGRQYNVSLPGLEIVASSGEAHQHNCLQALAAFTEPQTNPDEP